MQYGRDPAAGVFRSTPAQPAAVASLLPGVHADLVHVHVPSADGGGSRPGSVLVRHDAFVPPFAWGSDAAAAAALAAYDALMKRPYDHRQVLGRNDSEGWGAEWRTAYSVGC